MRAALAGDVVKIRKALAKGADPNCHTSPGRSTALMLAATNGTLASVMALLNKNANVNSRDSAGATALMFAAMSGKAEVVKALLKKGADPKIRAENGRVALDLAQEAGKKDVVEILQGK